MLEGSKKKTKKQTDLLREKKEKERNVVDRADSR